MIERRRPSVCRTFNWLSLVVAVSTALASTPWAQTPPSTRVDPPRIQFSYPFEEARLDREKVPLIALVTDESGITRLQLEVNGEPVSAVTAPTPPLPLVEIVTSVPLQTGGNVIAITATNQAGRTTQVIRRVYRVAAAVAPGPARPPDTTRGRYGVVIGVSAHASPRLPAVRSTEHDARAVYVALTEKGGYKKDNVLLITDSAQQKPTLANIKRALGEWLYKKVGPNDTVFIYYAGYAAPGHDRDGTGGYLVPRDADPESLFVSAFEIDDLEALMQRLPSGRVVLVLDTCARPAAIHPPSTPSTRGSAHLSKDFLDRLAGSRGRAVISAASLIPMCSDVSETRSRPFTYYLLRGMEGAADANRDRIVTARELHDYISRMLWGRTPDGSLSTPAPVMGGAGDFLILELRD